MKIKESMITSLLTSNDLEGFLLINDDKIINCNNRFAQMLGYLSKDELIGLGLFDLGVDIQANGNSSYKVYKEMANDAISKGISRFIYEFKTVSNVRLWAEVLFVVKDIENIINVVIKDITKWREIEDSIREDKTRYENIFNNTHTPILIIDPKKGNIKDVNAAACGYYKYTREEILKLKISDINILSNEEIYREMELARSENRKYFRFKHKLSNGEVRAVEVYSGPIIIDNDKLLVSIIHDVQEKKEIEIKYMLQETYFKYLFENFPEAIALLDNEFRILNINQSFEKIFLYKIDEIRHTNITRVICNEKFYDESSYIKDCIKNGEYIRKETKRRRKNGELLDVSLLAYPVIKDGEQIGIYSIYSDISKIKEEEKDKRLFSEIFKNNTVGVVVTDIEGNIQWINDAFTQVTGYLSEEIEGKNTSILKSGKHDVKYYSNMWNSILNDGKWQGEIFNKRKNGQIYQEWLNIIAVKDDNGNIEHFIGILSDITDSKQKQKKIEILTNQDSLTKLYNREYFINKLNYEISKREKNKEHEKKLAIFFLDIDDFKEINDTLGHLIGDEILKKFAQRLTNCLCEDNIITRFGGDEFILLLPTIEDEKQVTDIANLILEKLNASFIVNDFELNLMTSIGIAIYPDDGRDSTTLIRNADMAMYKSKEVKGSRFTVFQPILDKEIQEYFKIKNSLKYAISKDEFFLNYQPIYCSFTEKIVGTEALLRWNYKENKGIGPSKFIPIAEKSGDINSIGEWVLKAACIQNKRWQESGQKPIFVSVNVSILQLEKSSFYETVKRILKETGLEAKYLQLEITETIFNENNTKVLEVVKKLNELGVTFAIDDFGTGYSSLGTLSELKVNKIKIDRSFISGVNESFNKCNIVKAIISMAKSLNIELIAEGVETIEQLRFLKKNKCNMIQGYLFSKPVDSKVVEKILHKNHEGEL